MTPEEQEKQIALFKEQAIKNGTWDPVKHDEFLVRRFMNPKGYSIPETMAAWNAWLAWRKDWEVDTILEAELLNPKQLQRFVEIYPHGLHGVDLKGHPLLIYRLGKTKFSPLLADFPEVMRQKMHTQLYEFVMRVALPACSLAAGLRVDRVTTIYDLEGVSMMSTGSVATVLTSTTKILGLYYPETLAHLLIINAPSMFDSVFYASKGMLSPATQAKIQVFSKANTPAELAKLISPSQLPKFLGGTSGDNLREEFGPWTALENLPPPVAVPVTSTAAAAAVAAGAAKPLTDGAEKAVVQASDVRVEVPTQPAQMLRMLSRRDGAEPPADAEGLERFFSCVENNPEFARCISLAESRFLTKYATANKRYTAPNFANYNPEDDEAGVCEVEAVAEDGGAGGGAGGASRSAVMGANATAGAKAPEAKPSPVKEQAQCCSVM